MDNSREIQTKVPNPRSVDKKTLDRITIQNQLAGRPVSNWSQPEKDMVLEYLAIKYDLIPMEVQDGVTRLSETISG